MTPRRLSRDWRRLGAASAVLLVLGASSALLAPPAPAADPTPPAASLSWDGQRWGASLAGTLMPTAMRWVPGDVLERGFFVRNETDAAADLGVDVDLDDTALRPALSASVKVGSDPWERTTEAGAAVALAHLGPAEVRQVRLRVAFASESGSQTQARAARLGVAIRLSGAPDAPVLAPLLSPSQAPGLLASTGAVLGRWWGFGAGAAIVVGIALIGVARHGRRVSADAEPGRGAGDV